MLSGLACSLSVPFPACTYRISHLCVFEFPMETRLGQPVGCVDRAKRTAKKKKGTRTVWACNCSPYHILTFWLANAAAPTIRSDWLELDQVRLGTRPSSPRPKLASLSFGPATCKSLLQLKWILLLRRPRSAKLPAPDKAENLNLTRPDSPARCGDADLAAFLAPCKAESRK